MNNNNRFGFNKNYMNNIPKKMEGFGNGILNGNRANKFNNFNNNDFKNSLNNVSRGVFNLWWKM